MRHRAVHASRHLRAPRRARQFDRPTRHEYVVGVLMQLVELDSDPMRFASVSDYRAHIAQHASLDHALIGALRAYGTDLIAGIQDERALPLLRQEARAITRSRPFIGSAVAQGVIQAALDQAWDGVGGWRR